MAVDDSHPDPIPLATPRDRPQAKGRLAFCRQKRLIDKFAYRQVFSKAKRSQDRFFTVLFRLNTTRDRNEPRLGLAIAKKHCKLATGRNRIKRLVRESFRLNQAALPGLDIVVLNTPATHRAENRTLMTSLDRHWRRCSQSAGAIGKD